MESLFLLAFSEEEFLTALAIASSEAFFNKLLISPWKPITSGQPAIRSESIPITVSSLLELFDFHPAKWPSRVQRFTNIFAQTGSR